MPTLVLIKAVADTEYFKKFTFNIIQDKSKDTSIILKWKAHSSQC